ncbi:MAG TPA: hypothetical protein VK879_10740, partial [Candidatus Sulfomarinibacteraceae bacterium]|nr:hypothetical protein [Candidatus Sulfomarinibacteraceae bacterium]
PEAARSLAWWQWIVGIDVFFVVMTTLFPHAPNNPVKWHILQHFTLSGESNVAAWWSGFLLLLLSLFAFQLAYEGSRHKAAWFVFSLVMLGLSLDEVGSIHERVSAAATDTWGALLPYAIVLGILVAYVLLTLVRRPETRRAAVLIAVAFFLFGAVAGQEYLEHLVEWPQWTTGLRVGVEEGTELLAMLLIFVGLIHAAEQDSAIRQLRIIPDPARFPYLPFLLLGGLLFHLGASLTVSSLSDFERRGNPAIWVPLVLFVLLFARAISSISSKEGSARQHSNWFLAAAGAILLSIGSMYYSRIVIHQSVWYPGLVVLALYTVIIWARIAATDHSRQFLTALLGALLAYGVVLVALTLLQNLPAAQFLASAYLFVQVIVAASLDIILRGPLQGRRLVLWLAPLALALLGGVVGSEQGLFIIYGIQSTAILAIMLQPHLSPVAALQE